MSQTDERRCELCGESIELAPGRALALRHLRPDDGPGLAALYGRLRPEDIYRRFFTSAAPAAQWFDDWANIADRGGFGLVAVRTDLVDTQIVAEAGYAKLCSGDGELGIAVDPNARGWLGPWLLDSLLRHASARGIPNLQALVLSDNRRMATMANARGVATMSSDDWSTTRVSMSTSGRVPSWPGDGAPGDGETVVDGRSDGETAAALRRPRLLVESDRSRWAGAPIAIAAGFDVMVCRGPEARPHGCPLLQDGHCPLFEGADVVINVLDPASPTTTELLLGAGVVHPGPRVIGGYADVTGPGPPTRRPDADLVAEALELVVTEKDPPPA